MNNKNSIKTLVLESLFLLSLDGEFHLLTFLLGFSEKAFAFSLIRLVCKTYVRS